MIMMYDDYGNVVPAVGLEMHIRAEERKKIFDELYEKLMNETKESVIEWVQENLIDDVDDL